MNKIREMRQARGMRGIDLCAAMNMSGQSFGKPELSKVENGAFLPTVATAKELCRVFECDILDLYEAGEIDLVGLSNKQTKPAQTKAESACVAIKTPHKSVPIKTTYHLCAELPRELGDQITDDVLSKCGYSTRREWLEKCAKKLLARYGKIIKKEADRQKEVGGTANDEKRMDINTHQRNYTQKQKICQIKED